MSRNTTHQPYTWLLSKSNVITFYAVFLIAFDSTTAEPSVGELRFIARLSRSALPNGPTAATMYGGTAIEGSDVFTVNGQTRSKCNSSLSSSLGL
jgi:hypothetical protein